MKTNLTAILILVLTCGPAETFADAPKSKGDMGENLGPDHVVQSKAEAYRVINANIFRYIATPINGIEVQGWKIDPFACSTVVLQKSVKIWVDGVRTEEARKIYAKISAHNLALARWHVRPPPCIRNFR